MTTTISGTNGVDKIKDGTITVPDFAPGVLTPPINKIINGGMDIAQRGTSFPAIANAIYSLDRWLYGNVSASVITASQQADAPSSNEFQNSLRLAVTTADASIAASDISVIEQRIEGYNVRDLIGKTFSLSFSVRSSKTGIHCVSFCNSTADRSFVAEYSISAANTWETKTVAVPSGLITAGTWNWTTGVGLAVRFALASGSTYQAAANAWQTGNFYATANQVNCLDTIGNIFAITGVQLALGSEAMPFQHRPIGQELALCQRYYEAGVSDIGGYSGGAGIGCYYRQPFKVTKRISPTLGYGATGTVNVSVYDARAATPDSLGWFCSTTAAGGFVWSGTWTAVAEL